MKDSYNDARRMVEEINAKDLPFSLEIVNLDGLEGDYVLAKWKWMDSTYFSGLSITREIKEFSTYVKLEPNGKYRWFDTKEELMANLSPKKLTLTGESFYGKEYRINKTIVLGKDNQNDKVGAVSFELNTSTIHKPLENWLKENGYTKRRSTFKEHVNSFIASQSPAIGTIVGTVFTVVGFAFFITGLVIVIKGLTGTYFTINSVTNGVAKVVKSKESTISFGAFFAIFGAFFLTIGLLFLKWFLPRLIKLLKESKNNE